VTCHGCELLKQENEHLRRQLKEKDRLIDKCIKQLLYGDHQPTETNKPRHTSVSIGCDGHHERRTSDR
jgi:hypothetical protein